MKKINIKFIIVFFVLLFASSVFAITIESKKQEIQMDKNKGYFKENVQNIFRRFYTEWLPFSGYEYAGLPDVEVYPICKETPVSGHSEVWIAIKKDKEDGTCII